MRREPLPDLLTAGDWRGALVGAACAYEAAALVSGGRIPTITSEVHETVTDDEVDEVVDAALVEADASIEELRSEAHRGRFGSEKRRRAWFVIDALGRG